MKVRETTLPDIKAYYTATVSQHSCSNGRGIDTYRSMKQERASRNRPTYISPANL